MKITIAKSEEEFDLLAGWKIVTQMITKTDSVIGLSTGETTKGMHKVVSDIYSKFPFDTSQITLFGQDEFVLVPNDFPGTCSNDLHRQIVDPINIREENFIGPDPYSMEVEKESIEFEKELQTRGGIDLLMLGVGMDGHLGMNLPGTSFDTLAHFTKLSGELESRTRKLNNYPEPNPLGGITLGIRSIMNIKHIVLVAKGVHKAEIIKRALFENITTDVPASILQLHPSCEVLLDPKAGSLISDLI